MALARCCTFFDRELLDNVTKFVFGEHVVADRIFKFGTKYTIFILVSIAMVSQIFQNNMNCLGAGEKINVDEHCENVGTFLVKKALQAEMENEVIYPGVSPYEKGKDEVLVQRYYKKFPLIYAVLIGIAMIPYFLWKVCYLKVHF